LPTPPAFDVTVRRVPLGILPQCLVWKNWNSVAIRGRESFEDMFIHFDRIHERDGRTDRRVDRHAPHDGIGHAYA